MDKVDITIIGAGVIGLALAYKLSGNKRNIVVLERHKSFGQETSSRNSEVIHAGLYYFPGSLKAQTCIRGNELLYKLCAENNIPHKRLGKLVVACGEEEAKKINNIYKNALNSGVKNLALLEGKDIKNLEPNIQAKLALFSPETGIIDTHLLMNLFYQKASQQGVVFAFSSEAVGIDKVNSNRYKVTTKDSSGDLFSFDTHSVINAAGLNSDKIAQLAGLDIDKCGYRLHYCKGQYFRIKNPKKFSIKHLVYPPATKTDLGIHITPDLAGGLRFGPDASYVSEINYDIKEKDKDIFYKSVKMFLPSLELDDLAPDTVGIRPKLQGEGEDFRDFVIKEESDKGLSGFINLIGIESPGLTSCLAIAEKSIDILIKIGIVTHK